MADKSVNVLNPYGQPENIPEGSLSEAIKSGYSVPSQTQVSDYLNHKEYGEGIGNVAAAAGLGALRGLSLGTSDQFFTKSHLLEANTIKQLKEQNPTTSLLSEAGGVILPALATDGSALAEYAPAGLAMKAGRAATEAALPVAETATRIIANPETIPTAHKVLSQFGAHSLGSAIEASAFGAGQAVSEDALGDPNALSEKLMSHIGYSALIGGALGGTLGAVGAAIAKPQLSSFVSEADKPLMEAGDFGTTIKNSAEYTPEEKTGIIAGLRKLKPNASEIKDAAQEIGGAPILEGQLSDNKLVQRAEDALLNGPPTMASASRQNMAKQGFDMAERTVNDQMGDLAQPMSEAEVGNTIKDSLTKKMDAQKDVFDNLYGAIKDEFQTVPVSPNAIRSVSRNILKVDEQLGRLAPNSSQYKFLETMSERLKNVETVDDLKRLKSLMNDDLKKLGDTTPEMKRFGAIIGDKLSNLEQSTLVRFAEERMSDQPRVAQLLALRHEANSMYREFMEKASDLAEGLGKKRVHGPADLSDFIDNMNPQTLAKKLFNQNNVEFMQSFAKNFPEEMQAMRHYQMGQIRLEASKKGFFDVKRALKTINDMEPEARNILFTPEQLKKINAADTYVKAFPQSFNPSGTAHEQVLRHAFETGPVGALKANVRDYAIQKFIQAATPLDDVGVEHATKLGMVERMSQSTTRSIQQGAKAILKAGSSVPELEGYVGSKLTPDQKQLKADKKNQKTKDQIAELNELGNDPSKLIDQLDGSTKALSNFAPKTAQALQLSSARAVTFLASKVPRATQTSPLSAPFEPSKAQMATFNRYLNVVENPVSVLEHVKNSTLTSEHMEALTTVYPKLYSEMQSQIIDQLTNHISKKKDPLPYRIKMGMGIFLNQDLDGTMNATSILNNQQALMGNVQAQNEADKNMKVSQSGLGKISLATRNLTSQQSNSQRE